MKGVEGVRGQARRWWPAATAVTVALIGGLLLAGQMRQLHHGEAELAALRHHGRHASAHATLDTAFSSGGRGTSCETSSVWLDFTDATGDPVSEPEETIGGSLYVPHGSPDREGRVATTVVYDPAHPDRAQAVGALEQSVLDLARHHWLALTVALALLGAGITGGIAAWPRRAGR
ncbi:DUF3592 domain-containing protein [Streptomyces sp. NPDC001530]|uniref:DUF3592 domain-containing protein n=1 Tax=Streptomyces sp. NPDC001530 TaxID=3364582 RepID=UPI003699D40D